MLPEPYMPVFLCAHLSGHKLLQACIDESAKQVIHFGAMKNTFHASCCIAGSIDHFVLCLHNLLTTKEAAKKLSIYSASGILTRRAGTLWEHSRMQYHAWKRSKSLQQSVLLLATSSSMILLHQQQAVAES